MFIESSGMRYAIGKTLSTKTVIIMPSPLKHCYNYQTGFTLIELMIVIAIIGILASIAIPTYQFFISKSQANACLLEARAYSTQVFALINDQDDGTLPVAPVLDACQSITDATDWTLETQQIIEARPKAPSGARIQCDIPNGTPCRLLL